MMAIHWRLAYAIHPAAKCFPPLSDEELKALGEDIKANGLKSPIVFLDPGSIPDARPILVDGINRLEAMQRAGVNWVDEVAKNHKTIWREKDAVSYIISANIHRRHLSKQERADIIVALAKARVEKPGQVGPVSPGSAERPARPATAPVGHKGGRGVQNAVKQSALSINQELPKDQQVSERTIKRSIAKAEGKNPRSRVANLSERGRTIMKPPLRSKSGRCVGLVAARTAYLETVERLGVDLDHEREEILEAFQELAGKRAAMSGTAATAPPAAYPEMPSFLDRRQR